MADKEKANLKVLRAIRLGGKHVAAGTVISKREFASKGDWSDLCRMEHPKLAETDEKIGEQKTAAMPGSK